MVVVPRSTLRLHSLLKLPISVTSLHKTIINRFLCSSLYRSVGTGITFNLNIIDLNSVQKVKKKKTIV